MYDDEFAFQKALIYKLREKECHVTNIESHATSVGVPDLYVMHHGRGYWVELKIIRPHASPTLRLQQVRWIRGHAAAQGWVYLIAYSWAKEVFIIVPGRNAKHLIGKNPEAIWRRNADVICDTIEEVIEWITL